MVFEALFFIIKLDDRHTNNKNTIIDLFSQKMLKPSFLFPR